MSKVSKDTTRAKVTEDRVGPVLHYFLYPLSLLYGFIVRLRLFLYRARILKTGRVKSRVVSIGNITAGGTGKTPLVMHMARRFAGEGEGPVILSRGYGGSHAKKFSSTPGLVSDGTELLMGPEEAGDEPYQMARELLNIEGFGGGDGVPVIVSPDRLKGARFAVEKFRPGVIILDDGFQHIRLTRDVNILLIDPSKGPLSEARLLPRGLLREPLSALERADIFMIKGAGREARTMEMPLPVRRRFGFKYRPSKLCSLNDGRHEDPNVLDGKRVAIFSGIASPESFENTVLSLGAIIVAELTYPDHHRFSGADLKEIGAMKETPGGVDYIITTEKDSVRLDGFTDVLPEIHILKIEIEIDNEQRFFNRIKRGR